MLSKAMQDAMNEQIKNELYSASMSAYFEDTNLPGFAHWMRVQAQEEEGHAMKFYDFIHERGGHVVLHGHRPSPC
jgi:ferritin